MSQPVHVAITRKIKPGQEEAFEQAIRDFFSTTAKIPGLLGAQLIKPMPGDKSNEYGIIRSFETKEDHDAFYASDTFRQWVEYIQPFVELDYSRTKLHGMEAFFASKKFQSPPQWKMAAVTWLGVWPCVYLAARTIGPVHQGMGLPLWVGLGMETFAVVCTLTWLVMPNLTKLLDGWLTKK